MTMMMMMNGFWLGKHVVTATTGHQPKTVTWTKRLAFKKNIGQPGPTMPAGVARPAEELLKVLSLQKCLHVQTPCLKNSQTPGLVTALPNTLKKGPQSLPRPEGKFPVMQLISVILPKQEQVIGKQLSGKSASSISSFGEFVFTTQYAPGYAVVREGGISFSFIVFTMWALWD